MMGIGILLLLALIFTPKPAFAYIDPGTGSAIVSMLIGSFVTVSIAIKTYWYKLKLFFQNRKKQTKDDQ